MKRRFDSKNAGFTLIELIVVVAIISVLTGGIAISYSRVSRAGVKSAALDARSLVSEARINQMSKAGSFAADIYVANDGCIHGQMLKDGAVDRSVSSSSEVKFARSEISIEILNANTEASIGTLSRDNVGKHLCVGFRRSSGRLCILNYGSSANMSNVSDRTDDVILRVGQGDYRYDVKINSLTGTVQVVYSGT